MSGLLGRKSSDNAHAKVSNIQSTHAHTVAPRRFERKCCIGDLPAATFKLLSASSNKDRPHRNMLLKLARGKLRMSCRSCFAGLLSALFAHRNTDTHYHNCVKTAARAATSQASWPTGNQQAESIVIQLLMEHVCSANSKAALVQSPL